LYEKVLLLWLVGWVGCLSHGRQLLLNLRHNAIKYNQPKGMVNISLHNAGGFAESKIENTGEGFLPNYSRVSLNGFFGATPATATTRLKVAGLA
jgi:hypothetical protein